MANETELALGRILRIAARPEQPGDVTEYERCRAIIMADADEVAVRQEIMSRLPDYARDRLRGALGDAS